MAYMLATVELRYGMLVKFNEILDHVKPKVEEKGWRLLGAWRVTVGQLYTVYDLWEIPDANSIQSVLNDLSQDAEFTKWAADLPECVQKETLEILEKLPYSP